MPTASLKAETNGVLDSNDPLDRIQNELASRLSELEEKKVELDTDSAHPRAVFYKNLSKDVIQYKKLSPDQLNHLREMDAVYSTLDAVREISKIVNDGLNEHRTKFKKQQKKASQEKAREIFERVKEVLKIQSSLELAVTHPQLFLEPPSQDHPTTSSDQLEKLQRIHALITPPCVTDSTKSIGDAVHAAAQHIHLLVDGRNKFVTKGTTYEDVKAQFIDRASVCSYYIEKVVEPEPEESDQETDEEVQQLASELEASQLNQDKQDGEVVLPSEGTGVEDNVDVSEASQAMSHSAELPSSGIVSLEKNDDHLAISSAGPVPVDPSAAAAVYMIRDPTQHPPPPPGLQPHPQQQTAAPLLMGQGLPQQQAMQSQEAFAAALSQQQQQHMHVMYQLEQQQQLEHQQHLEQQHLLQQREQQQQQHQLEEEHDDGNSIHNDSIKDLLTLSDFNFLQESVIDKPTATGSPAPSVSEAAVYMDPAIVSVVSMGSVNPAESVPVPAGEPLVAPVDHFMAAAAAAVATPPQAPQQQLTISAPPPPPVVTSQKLSHASNNLATIPTPNFPPTIPPPTTSLANVPPPPVHASNARPPPSSHPLESEQFFSHAPPPPPHTASYQTDNMNYSAPPPPPAAASAPQTSLTPTLDSTPNPPPPIPLPQEHTSSNWDQPNQNWVDDQPQMNGGGQTSPNNSAEVQQSASSDWSAAPVEEKSRRSNRSWASEEGDNIATSNWGSDVRSPPRGPQMSQQEDYDRKMGGVNNTYRNGPPHRMRRDGGELEDYGSHDDGGYWGEEDYDDRRGMYARGRGGRGRINNNHTGGGGYRGRGGYNGNGYQNGRGGYGPQGGFRNRGGMGGPNGGGFRGMRGANRGGGGMPRGGGGNAGGSYRSGRGSYSVQRPYYGQ